MNPAKKINSNKLSSRIEDQGSDLFGCIEMSDSLISLCLATKKTKALLCLVAQKILIL